MTAGFKNINIGRYKGTSSSPFFDHDFAGTRAQEYSGWIEGTTADDKSWILYLDTEGRPSIFWPEREKDGAVVGEGIKLSGRRPGQFAGVFEQLRVEDDADTWDESGPRNEEVVASFPVWWPGLPDEQKLPEGEYPPDTMRGIVFAVVPGEFGNASQRMRHFIGKLSEGFGMNTPDMARRKLEEILASGTPEDVVLRLRRALDADLEAPDVREIHERISDERATQKASHGLPDVSGPVGG